ncbi:NAD(P)-binding protein [Atractiella rhizophila]|nr:NAD(P)-binding protein [Atractiella rhizophila]
MVIASTSDSSAPLFTVVGASGNQGRSTVFALQSSTKRYRVRAVGRDAQKEIMKHFAELGCELLVADVTTEAGAECALRGTDIAFVMTLTEFGQGAKEMAGEVQKGKVLMDACAICGVKQVIYTGSTHLGNLSNIPCYIWDAKAEVTLYARSLASFSLYEVCTGSFFETLITQRAPKRSEKNDGSFVLSMPYFLDTPIPVIDTPEDFGKYAIAALEHDIRDEPVYAATEYITPVQLAQAFEKVSGKRVVAEHVNDKESLEKLRGAFKSEDTARDMFNVAVAVRTVGYYGGADLEKSNKILSRPARRLDDMMRAHREKVLMIFS